MIRNSLLILLAYFTVALPTQAQVSEETFDQVNSLIPSDVDSAMRVVERLSQQVENGSVKNKDRFYRDAANFYNRLGDYTKESHNLKKLIPFLPKKSDTLYAVLIRLGMAQLNSGKFESSKRCFERCIAYYTKQNTDAAGKAANRDGKIKSYNGLASVLVANGDCSNAIDFYYKSINLLESTKDYLQLSRTYSNLSIAYTCLGEKRKSMEVRKKSYHFALLSDDEEEIHFGRLNMGGAYNALEQLDSALYYLKLAEPYFEEQFNAQILNAIYNELGAVYSKSGQNEQAEAYYLKSIKLLKSGGFDFALPGTLANYGNVLLAKGNYTKGIEACREALSIAKKIQYTEVQMIACDCLYQNFKSTNATDSALFYLENKLLLKDSIANAELQKASLRKELENTHSKEKQGIISSANKELSQVVNFRNVLIVGIGILLLALAILLFSFRQKKRSVAYIQREKQYLDDLVHNLVHEFRTPLTLIKGPAEELLRTDKSNALLQLVNKNGERLLDLVNQVLDFSKIKAGKMALSEEITDVHVFLSGTVELFVPLAQAKNINLKYRNDLEHSVVLIDSDKLFKVVSNLLSNAVKYSREGDTILLRVAHENKKLVLTIEDTGIGIPPNELKNVFRKFYQVDATLTRKEEGTGLGLAFVDELVQLMKGSIRLESVLNKGTTVTVSFPYKTATLLQPAVSHVPQPAAIPIEQHEAAEVENPFTVLVIEDNADLQSFLRMLLVQEGYEVHIAGDGEQGIEMAIETIPDLIISDVMMPKKDGYQVLKHLKQHEVTEHIPIMLLTAKASFDSMIDGLEIGADDYLAKPFKSQELLLRVNNHIRHQLKIQQKYQTLSAAKDETIVKHPLIEKIEAIIAQEDGIHGSVEDLADACAMSRSQLHRKVKQLTGLSTTALLTKIRLDNALLDLTATDMSISEIAYKWGYSDPANFSRLFKKQFGQPPSELRNSVN